MDKYELCRICTKCSKSGQSSNLFNDDKNKLIIQIQEITGMLLQNSKQMPGFICKPCEEDLGKAYEFRERCIFAQEYFKSLECKEKSKKTDDPYAGSFAEDDFKDEQPIEENHVGETFFFKEESFDEFQGEFVEESCSRHESANDEREDKLALGDLHEKEPLESHEDHDDEYSPFNKKTKNKCKPKTKKYIAKPIKVVAKADGTDIASSTKSNKAKRNKLDDQDEKNHTFICDQCGNYFTSRNHFRIHLLRHTGEKRFQCELCADKFFTNSELNRHMRKHTGERPFACKHCGRRFTDYSTRVKHERTHTNERPFACTQCAKAFTTSYILKNHMLVHTGERSFKCNLCVKSFQRQTHLVVHYRSIMHQQNEEKLKQGSCRAATNNVDTTEITMLKY